MSYAFSVLVFFPPIQKKTNEKHTHTHENGNAIYISLQSKYAVLKMDVHQRDSNRAHTEIEVDKYKKSEQSFFYLRTGEPESGMATIHQQREREQRCNDQSYVLSCSTCAHAIEVTVKSAI